VELLVWVGGVFFHVGEAGRGEGLRSGNMVREIHSGTRGGEERRSAKGTEFVGDGEEMRAARGVELLVGDDIVMQRMVRDVGRSRLVYVGGGSNGARILPVEVCLSVVPRVRC
jgi:hypothetical protein